MKRTIVKAVSLVLAFSFLTALASCTKKEKPKKSKIIAEDTPWFDYTTIDVDSGADPEKGVEYLNQNLAGADDKYYVIYSSGRYQTPPENEIDYSNFDYNSYNFNIVAVVDRNTKKAVNYLDLNKGLDISLHVGADSTKDNKIGLTIDTVCTNAHADFGSRIPYAPAHPLLLHLWPRRPSGNQNKTRLASLCPLHGEDTAG